MTPQEALLKAAEYIEDHGHCQFELQDQEGRVCARGALLAVLTGDPNRHTDSDPAYMLRVEAERMVESTVGAQYIITWNNQEGRTEGEVVRAFRKAAQLTEVP